MSKVDQNVLDALKDVQAQASQDEQEGEAKVPVIVVCDQGCISVAETMKKQQIFVTQIIPELEMLIAKVSADDLAFFETSEEVIAVELDEDVETN